MLLLGYKTSWKSLFRVISTDSEPKWRGVLRDVCQGPVLARCWLIFALFRGLVEETTWLTKLRDGLDRRGLDCQRTGLSLKWNLDKWIFNVKKVSHYRKVSVVYPR